MNNLCRIESILDSWKRCISKGLDPNILHFKKSKQDFTTLLQDYQSLIETFNQLIDNISAYIAEEHYFLLCNQTGTVIAQRSKKKFIV